MCVESSTQLLTDRTHTHLNRKQERTLTQHTYVRTHLRTHLATTQSQHTQTHSPSSNVDRTSGCPTNEACSRRNSPLGAQQYARRWRKETHRAPPVHMSVPLPLPPQPGVRTAQQADGCRMFHMRTHSPRMRCRVLLVCGRFFAYSCLLVLVGWSAAAAGSVGRSIGRSLGVCTRVGVSVRVHEYTRFARVCRNVRFRSKCNRSRFLRKPTEKNAHKH